jgi:hypothetical protein
MAPPGEVAQLVVAGLTKLHLASAIPIRQSALRAIPIRRAGNRETVHRS